AGQPKAGSHLSVVLVSKGAREVRAMEAEKAERLIAQMCEQIEEYAPNWGYGAVGYLAATIREWSQWNGAGVIPLERRRRIRRCASKLLTELKEIGTLEELKKLG